MVGVIADSPAVRSRPGEQLPQPRAEVGTAQHGVEHESGQGEQQHTRLQHGSTRRSR